MRLVTETKLLGEARPINRLLLLVEGQNHLLQTCHLLILLNAQPHHLFETALKRSSRAGALFGYLINIHR